MTETPVECVYLVVAFDAKLETSEVDSVWARLADAQRRQSEMLSNLDIKLGVMVSKHCVCQGHPAEVQ